MQPVTPIIGKPPRGFAKRFDISLPISPIAFNSACSRTEHVLTTIASAQSGESANSQPRSAKSAAIWSESRSFIWQPYVLR